MLFIVLGKKGAGGMSTGDESMQFETFESNLTFITIVVSVVALSVLSFIWCLSVLLYRYKLHYRLHKDESIYDDHDTTSAFERRYGNNGEYVSQIRPTSLNRAMEEQDIGQQLDDNLSSYSEDNRSRNLSVASRSSRHSQNSGTSSYTASQISEQHRSSHRKSRRSRNRRHSQNSNESTSSNRKGLSFEPTQGWREDARLRRASLQYPNAPV